MERVKNLDEYKELLRWNKARFESLEKNCFLLASGMNKFILENRLYAEKYENGLVFFIDEGRYYNLYYFWKKEAELEDFRQNKPVLIEEINSNGNRDEYLEKFEVALEKAGFALLKNNLQVELSLADHKELIEEQFIERLHKLEQLELELAPCKTQEDMEQVVSLWEEYLDLTDVPEEHLTLNEEDTLVCVYDKDGKVASTNWWRNTGKTSEGRHTVTHPDYYQKGLASTLLLAWCKDALDNGVNRCFTWICDTNFRSLGLYEKMGFVVNGRTSKQYILK